MASTGFLTVNSCIEMVVPGRDERGLYVIVLHWKGNGGRKYSQEGKESYTRPRGARECNTQDLVEHGVHGPAVSGFSFPPLLNPTHTNSRGIMNLHFKIAFHEG